MARLFEADTPDYLAIDTQNVVTSYPITLAGWFKRSVAGDDNGTIIGYGDHAENKRYHLLTHDEDVGKPRAAVICRGVGGVQTTQITAAAGDVEEWNHYAGTFEQTSRYAFINGEKSGEGVTDISFPPADREIYIGVSPRDIFGNAADGSIAEVALWNVVLSDTEISALASGVWPSKVRPANLLGYWEVGGNESPEPEGSGKQYQMILVGAPSLANHAPVIWHGPRWCEVIDVGGGLQTLEAVPATLTADAPAATLYRLLDILEATPATLTADAPATAALFAMTPLQATPATLTADAPATAALFAMMALEATPATLAADAPVALLMQHIFLEATPATLTADAPVATLVDLGEPIWTKVAPSAAVWTAVTPSASVWTAVTPAASIWTKVGPG